MKSLQVHFSRDAQKHKHTQDDIFMLGITMEGMGMVSDNFICHLYPSVWGDYLFGEYPQNQGFTGCYNCEY